MKKSLFALVVALAASVLFAQMPRSEWHAKVGECALDPVALRTTISKLSSADKTAFLAEVNDAISKMPGSPEAKTAQFLVANRAAIVGAGSADRAAVLSEMFATVPPESLTVIVEEFAKNEFARTPTMDDKRFVKIVSDAMEKIVRRCESAESGAVRAAFAGVMFVRAAGGAEDSAMEAVVNSLPESSRSEARSSWLPSAVGKEQAPSYDSMLGVSQAGEEPDHSVTVSIFSQQILDSMLSDLQAGVLSVEPESKAMLEGDNQDFFNGDVDAMHVKNPTPSRDRVQLPTIPESFITGDPADKDKPVVNPSYTEDRGEPGPYWLQQL